MVYKYVYCVVNDLKKLTDLIIYINSYNRNLYKIKL